MNFQGPGITSNSIISLFLFYFILRNRMITAKMHRFLVHNSLGISSSRWRYRIAYKLNLWNIWNSLSWRRTIKFGGNDICIVSLSLVSHIGRCVVCVCVSSTESMSEIETKRKGIQVNQMCAKYLDVNNNNSSSRATVIIATRRRTNERISNSHIVHLVLRLLRDCV